MQRGNPQVVSTSRDKFKATLQNIFAKQNETPAFEAHWARLDSHANNILQMEVAALSPKSLQSLKNETGESKNANTQEWLLQSTRLYLAAFQADLVETQRKNAELIAQEQKEFDNYAETLKTFLASNDFKNPLNKALINTANAKLAAIKARVNEAKLIAHQAHVIALTIADSLLEKKKKKTDKSSSTIFPLNKEHLMSLVHREKRALPKELAQLEGFVSMFYQKQSLVTRADLAKTNNTINQSGSALINKINAKMKAVWAKTNYKPQPSNAMAFGGVLIMMLGLGVAATAANVFLTGSLGALGWVAAAAVGLVVSNPAGWMVLAAVATIGVIGAVTAGLGALMGLNSMRRLQRNVGLQLYKDKPELQQALHEQNEGFKKDPALKKMPRLERMFMLKNALLVNKEQKPEALGAVGDAATVWKSCSVAGQQLPESVKLLQNIKTGQLMWRVNNEVTPVDREAFHHDLHRYAPAVARRG